MTYAARLRKVGGSVMLAIPKPMLDELALGPDAAVGLSVKAGRLVIDPKRRRRYTLDELISQSKRSGKRLRSDPSWVAGKPAGRELI
jgi:antitoxin ChpS